MNKPVTPKIKQLLFDKGWRYVLSKIYDPEIGGTRVMHSLGEQRWNEGDLSYVDITIAEVVMWLYEKHGIWIYVECDGYGEEWTSKLSVASKEKWEDINKRHNILTAHRYFNPKLDSTLKRNFTSPSEAYEEAIKYTLNNLI